jgi:hypothetical protein
MDTVETTTGRGSETQQGEVREGMRVRDARGTKIGAVSLCEEEAFVVEQGFFFPKELRVGYANVAETRDGEVWLRLSKDELSIGVHAPPQGP